MGYFKVKDKHLKFAMAIAAGKPQHEAYVEFIAVNKACKLNTAKNKGSVLAKRPQIQKLVQNYRDEKNKAIAKITTREIGKEFFATLLTTDELDNFHCAIIQGQVMVEEVIPVYTYEEILDGEGRIVKKVRKPSFMKVTRPPNVREKQISVDALFKRRGNYAPTKLFGAIGRVNEDGEVENIERFVLLANGEKIPL